METRIETTKPAIRLLKRAVEYAKHCAKTHGINVTELIDRYVRRIRALEQHDTGFRYFDIATVGRKELLCAHALGWKDFEDAVVAAAAEASNCALIVTRNIRDYRGSTVAVMTPEECLLSLPTN